MLRQRRDADTLRVLGPIGIYSAQILNILVPVGAKSQAARLAARRGPVADGAGPDEAGDEVDSWTLSVATRLWHNCVIYWWASSCARELSTCLLGGEADRADSSCVAYADACVECLTDRDQIDKV